MSFDFQLDFIMAGFVLAIFAVGFIIGLIIGKRR
jgi:hypothetical protein